MKKILSLLLALIMVFALCACGNASAATTTPEATEPPAEETPEAAAVDTTILYEQDEAMINTYTVIAVNPDAPFVDENGNAVTDVAVNTAGAAALIDWLLSEESMTLIANYGYEEYGNYLFYLLDGAPVYEGDIPAATPETATIRLSTTTSVNDSGLLSYLLPVFEDEYGYTVEVHPAGTGAAIAAATYGNADLILVHSKSQEEPFVDAGYSYILPGFDSERLSFMYNYFVLCGPSSDPAGVKDAPTVKDAFALIADGGYTFVSRGDNSGTHTKEVSLWPESLGITKEADSFADYSWYVSANAGMGVCLTMAEEMGAYILTDKATYLTFYANGGVISVA